MVRSDRIPHTARGFAAQPVASIDDLGAGVARVDTAPEFPARHHSQPNRVEVRERSSIWEVRVDGVFRGDYHLKEHALTAAADHRRSL